MFGAFAQVGGLASISSSGAITVTFTWVPNDPNDLLPPVAILRKTAMSQWTGFAGAASDGLGHPETPLFPNGGNPSGNSFEILQDPGASVVRTVTPSVDALSVPPPEFTNVATGEVGVEMQLDPVRINFRGTVILHGIIEAILPGQHLISEVEIPSGYLLEDIEWDAKGPANAGFLSWGPFGVNSMDEGYYESLSQILNPNWYVSYDVFFQVPGTANMQVQGSLRYQGQFVGPLTVDRACYVEQIGYLEYGKVYGIPYWTDNAIS